MNDIINVMITIISQIESTNLCIHKSSKDLIYQLSHFNVIRFWTYNIAFKLYHCKDSYINNSCVYLDFFLFMSFHNIGKLNLTYII